MKRGKITLALCVVLASCMTMAEVGSAMGPGLRGERGVLLWCRDKANTWEDLEFARHRDKQERIWNEKPPRAETCLNIDIRQLGLGGASCGPRPEAEYIFPIREERWSITLSPETGKESAR